MIQHYREHGWALLPGVAAHAVHALRERHEQLVREGHPELFFQPDAATGNYADVVRVHGWSGAEVPYRKIEKLERDPVFRSWIENEQFARIAREVIGIPALLYRAVLFCKAPRIGSDTPWHQDGGRLWGLDREPRLQIWTALDDAPPEAGGLEVLSGSHHRGLATPLGGVVPQEMAEGVRGVHVPARAGDVVILHNHLWHRSGPNTTDHPRRAFTICLLEAGTRCVRTRKAPRVFERVYA